MRAWLFVCLRVCTQGIDVPYLYFMVRPSTSGGTGSTTIVVGGGSGGGGGGQTSAGGVTAISSGSLASFGSSSMSGVSTSSIYSGTGSAHRIACMCAVFMLDAMSHKTVSYASACANLCRCEWESVEFRVSISALDGWWRWWRGCGRLATETEEASHARLCRTRTSRGTRLSLSHIHTHTLHAPSPCSLTIARVRLCCFFLSGGFDLTC